MPLLFFQEHHLSASINFLSYNDYNIINSIIIQVKKSHNPPSFVENINFFLFEISDNIFQNIISLKLIIFYQYFIKKLRSFLATETLTPTVKKKKKTITFVLNRYFYFFNEYNKPITIHLNYS